jgi:hypothetical protein
MADAELLPALTDLIAKQADILLALVNFYGLVVIAVIGWIVNTGKDGPGVSWFRLVLFNLGFMAFFAAHFAGTWYVYERFERSIALWAQTAGGGRAITELAWLPPKTWLFAIWAFNAIILVLASVLLRQGGYGRKPPAGIVT